MKKFKRHRDYGFFDQDMRLSKLGKLGDPLERLDRGGRFRNIQGIIGKQPDAIGKGQRLKTPLRPCDAIQYFDTPSFL